MIIIIRYSRRNFLIRLQVRQTFAFELALPHMMTSKRWWVQILVVLRIFCIFPNFQSASIQERRASLLTRELQPTELVVHWMEPNKDAPFTSTWTEQLEIRRGRCVAALDSVWVEACNIVSRMTGKFHKSLQDYIIATFTSLGMYPSFKINLVVNI